MDKTTALTITYFLLLGWIHILATGKAISMIIDSIRCNYEVWKEEDDDYREN